MRVLIVEDEYLIALDLEGTVLNLGHQPIGPASRVGEAMDLAHDAEVAFVDVRLLDGETGPEIARRLDRDFGVSVLFVTGNPETVADNPHAIGILVKPYNEREIADALEYAVSLRNGETASPPRSLWRRRSVMPALP
ncbi:response regulator [Rhizobium cauense]|uniref:response regulator n=1 Tax=Rhizobium cauense TaxID=1166683 RepID=UPI001C6E69CC|nr:response regulator [Rhizobium cauense]MBW9117649.1 response regulator [Rhizobium cauense]